MIVVHLSTSDLRGGAAKGAFKLHQGLVRVGVDSRMLVSDKVSNDKAVQAVVPEHALLAQLRSKLRFRKLAREFARYRSTRPAHLDFFSDDRTPYPNALPRAIPHADVYNLHWVAGFVDYDTFFRGLPRDSAVVWTLRDMNAFTGGCHYTTGCGKFKATCGACPALGSDDAHDLTSRIFQRKRAAYEWLRPERVRLIAPSHWMAANAAQSALLGRFDVSVIPQGLDTDIFMPRDRVVAREVFGIPQDLKIVMFAAQSLERHRKGMDLLIEALNGIDSPGNIGVVTVGAGRIAMPLRHKHFPIGELSSERLLSFVYSLADVFVTPAREENFGKVGLEAMACGTPVVGFAVGGNPDMVRVGQTGLLAPPEDVSALRDAIKTILGDDALRNRMGTECRRVAVEEYRLELMAERYRHLYEKLLAGTVCGPSKAAPARAASHVSYAPPDVR